MEVDPGSFWNSAMTTRCEITVVDLLSDQLLQRISQQQCVIEWKDSTRELIRSNEACDNWSDIARLVKLQEQIDCFMSHSWHDDPLEKYNALERSVSKFERERRRQSSL